jgi:type IV pilus assembly protein PilN
MTEMIIEERMWFTVLSVNGNSISLGGIALDERTIADFMKRLETKGGYANVTLKSLQRKEIKGKSLNLKSFNLSLNLPVSKSAKEKNKAGKTKKS